MKSRAPVLLAVALTAAMAVVATPAAAQSAMDSIVEVYRSGAASWGPTLRNYALGLFGILALIEVSFTFTRMALRGADMNEFLAELVGRMLFIGFFLWVLLQSGPITSSIVESFRQAGNSAAVASGGSGGVRPSDIFEAGMSMATTVMETDTGWGIEQIGEKIMLVICAIVIALCFALMAAFLILALVESYIVMSAGTLLLGFGGSRWTKDFAVKQLVYCVSVGAKLFVIQLLIGIGEAMVKTWASAMGPGGTPTSFEDVMTMLGSSVVMLALTKTIPDTVQGIINGVSPGGGGAMTAATAAVAGAGAAAAMSMIGGGKAVSGASRLASEQLKSSGGAAGNMSGFGKAAAHVGQMGKNMASAAREDIGARLSGSPMRGTMGGRMGQAMSQQAKELRASGQTPIQPQAMNPAAFAAAGAQGGSIHPGGSGAGNGGGANSASAAGSAASASAAGPSAAEAAAANAGAAASNDPIYGAAAADAPGETSEGRSASASAGAAAGDRPTDFTVNSAGQTARASAGGERSDAAQSWPDAPPRKSGLGDRLSGGAGPTKPTIRRKPRQP